MNEKPADNEVGSTPTPPTVARTGAVAAVASGLEDKIVPRKQVWSWALWDWATQPFNTVILTFVFAALYLVSDSFMDPAIAALGPGAPEYESALAQLTANLGVADLVAGIFIALLAPVLGQRSDASGNRKLWLGIATGLLVISTGALFFVEEGPQFFWLGAFLIAAGSVFGEIGGVNYNAMLTQVSTPKSVGRVSGLGWGFGYLGGIVAMIIVVVADANEFFGLPLENGLPFRVIAVGCAIWTVIFALPLFFNVPEAPPAAGRERVSFFRSYAVLVTDVKRLFVDSRQTFWFLLSAAVYRDGLAGVFRYGAILAPVAFGFAAQEVIIFGIVANLVAGVSTIFAGRLDDRFGARRVIIFALGGLIVSGLLVFLLQPVGAVIFWVFGLALTAFVGPVQAASRSLLARVTPAGREGEIFGLYATTGRAASVLSPAAWVLFVTVFGAAIFGILGIVIILAIGLVLMLFVKPGEHAQLSSRD